MNSLSFHDSGLVFNLIDLFEIILVVKHSVPFMAMFNIVKLCLTLGKVVNRGISNIKQKIREFFSAYDFYLIILVWPQKYTVLAFGTTTNTSFIICYRSVLASC